MGYCIDTTAESPIFLINKHIGFDEIDGMGVDGKEFAKELLYVDTLGKSAIQIWINSPGGVVTDGYDIFSAILKTKTPVDTYCIGAAASIAGVFFQAGRKRIMSDYAWLMYHNPFHSASDATKETKDLLAVMRDSLIKMVSQKSGMSSSDVAKMFDRTSYIPSDEALSMGLCDRVDESSKENTKHLRAIKNTNVFMHECNRMVASILDNKNTNLELKNSKTVKNMDNITKVTMRLRLNDSAPQEDIVAAIDQIENRAKLAEAKIEEIQNRADVKAKADSEELAQFGKKLKDALKNAEDAQAAYNDCKSKLDAMETEKDEVEKAAKADKAKNMVEGFAKVGRIKNEAAIVAKWTALAIADFDGAKNMIEELPLNKVAVTAPIELASNRSPIDSPMTAVEYAAANRIKNKLN